MTVSAPRLEEAVRLTIESWGWTVTESLGDVIFSQFGDRVEIRITDSLHPDDVAFLPLRKEELEYRIQAALARRARFAKRLHDLRSPLNAIQGYAEIILETVEGDAVRFAGNIRTATETLTSHLETFRDEGI